MQHRRPSSPPSLGAALALAMAGSLAGGPALEEDRRRLLPATSSAATSTAWRPAPTAASSRGRSSPTWRARPRASSCGASSPRPAASGSSGGGPGRAHPGGLGGPRGGHLSPRRTSCMLGEVQVYALKSLADGSILAGTSPGGGLYLVRGGKVARARGPAGRCPSSTSASLPTGSRRSSATGNPGRIYRVDLAKFASAGVSPNKATDARRPRGEGRRPLRRGERPEHPPDREAFRRQDRRRLGAQGQHLPLRGRRAARPSSPRRITTPR